MHTCFLPGRGPVFAIDQTSDECKRVLAVNRYDDVCESIRHQGMGKLFLSRNMNVESARARPKARF